MVSLCDFLIADKTARELQLFREPTQVVKMQICMICFSEKQKKANFISLGSIAVSLFMFFYLNIPSFKHTNTNVFQIHCGPFIFLPNSRFIRTTMYLSVTPKRYITWLCCALCCYGYMFRAGQFCVMHVLILLKHDDVIKWKHFPRYWPFVRGIHRSPVNSPHKGQWHGALMYSLICARTNNWANNGDAGDLRRHPAHYDVIVMGQLHRHWIESLPLCQWSDTEGYG